MASTGVRFDLYSGLLNSSYMQQVQQRNLRSEPRDCKQKRAPKHLQAHLGKVHQLGDLHSEPQSQGVLASARDQLSQSTIKFKAKAVQAASVLTSANHTARQ